MSESIDTVYVCPDGPSWHADPDCDVLDTARFLGWTITETSDHDGRPACIVCVDTERTEWTVTEQTVRELWELIGPSKLHYGTSPSGTTEADGLTIWAHAGQPKQVARFGDIIRLDHPGRYTVHPATEETPR